MFQQIDSNILVYALRVPRARDREEQKHVCQDAKILVAGLPLVAISALTVIEVLRILKPIERVPFKNVIKKMRVIPVTAEVSEFAVYLLDKRSGSEKVCPRCLGARKRVECKDCKASVSSQQRLNDAMIAATAEVHSDIDVLYTADTGVRSFQPYISNARIEDLPNGDGPLFARKGKP